MNISIEIDESPEVIEFVDGTGHDVTDSIFFCNGAPRIFLQSADGQRNFVAIDADGRKSTGARLVDGGAVATVGRSGKVWTIARCADARQCTADAMAASRKARNVKSVVKRQAQRRTAAIDKLVSSVRTWNTLTARQRQGATQSWSKSDAATRHAACVALGVGLRWATTGLATLAEHVGPATDRVLVDASALAVNSDKRL